MIPVVIIFVAVDMENPTNSMYKLKQLYWVYALFSPTMLEGFLQAVFLEYQYTNDGICHYFSNSSSAQPCSIFSLIDIVIYAATLSIIVNYRKSIQRYSAKSNFNDYTNFFKAQKEKHEVTDESEKMVKEVENNHDYAVRIDNASRLFFNTEGNPIPAVNCVSLGVKKGSIFGFLGANGAGKRQR